MNRLPRRAIRSEQPELKGLISDEVRDNLAAANHIWISIFAALQHQGVSADTRRNAAAMLPVFLQAAIQHGVNSRDEKTLTHTQEDYDKLSAQIIVQLDDLNVPSGSVGKRRNNDTTLEIPDQLQPAIAEVVRRGFLFGRHDVALQIMDSLPSQLSSEQATITLHDETATSILLKPAAPEKQHTLSLGRAIATRLVNRQR